MFLDEERFGGFGEGEWGDETEFRGDSIRLGLSRRKYGGDSTGVGRKAVKKLR